MATRFASLRHCGSATLRFLAVKALPPFPALREACLAICNARQHYTRGIRSVVLIAGLHFDELYGSRKHDLEDFHAVAATFPELANELCKAVAAKHRLLAMPSEERIGCPKCEFTATFKRPTGQRKWTCMACGESSAAHTWYSRPTREIGLRYLGSLYR